MMLFQFIDDNGQHLQRLLLLILLIQIHNSIRERHILLCPAIVQPRNLPWTKLYQSTDPVSFLHMTGLTRPTFVMLLDYLFDLEDIARRCQCGHPCSLGPEGYLGLLLFFLGSTMQYKHLCLIFGNTPSVCSRVINTMLKKVVRRLWSHLFAQVKVTNAAKMREFADMVQEQEPLVSNIIGFMDGISFPAECTDKHIKQNAYYCGYDCDTMVNNVFAYGPNGKVFFAAINFPGSWADGSLTAHFLGHLKAKIRDYKICVDQGFPQSGDAYGTLVGPVTKRAARRLHCSVRDYLLWISNVNTSLWQASEWGMRGLQGMFLCCKKCLPSNSEQRHLVLEAIVLVHNFLTEYLGYSQIKSVFDPEYVRVENLHGYDRIAQYYFRPGEYNSEVDGSGNGSDDDYLMV
jgi:hypothetical protein